RLCATEVEGQRAEDRVRPEARRNVTAELIDEIEPAGVEEAILEASIDVAGERSADARDRLPREARVRIVEERTGEDRSDLDARDTGTAADEALQAIVVAEVEHAVDHEAERVGVAVQGIGTR